jgi:hypothetical protein
VDDRAVGFIPTVPPINKKITSPERVRKLVRLFPTELFPRAESPCSPDDLRHRRSAGEDAADWLRRPPSRRDDIVRRRLRVAGIQLVVHAAGGLLVLLVPVALSVYKPPGMTRYGERM